MMNILVANRLRFCCDAGKLGIIILYNIIILQDFTQMNDLFFWYMAFSNLVQGVFCTCSRVSLLLTGFYSLCITVFASIHSESIPRQEQYPYSCRTRSVFNMSKFKQKQMLQASLSCTKRSYLQFFM